MWSPTIESVGADTIRPYNMTERPPIDRRARRTTVRRAVFISTSDYEKLPKFHAEFSTTGENINNNGNKNDNSVTECGNLLTIHGGGYTGHSKKRYINNKSFCAK